MMRPVQCVMVFLTCFLLFMNGCERNNLNVDVSGIEIGIELERFDQALFEMDLDTVTNGIDFFYNVYGDFFDIFNVQVINIGPASARRYPSFLSMFINDPTNIEVYEITKNLFISIDKINAQLTDGFKHYLYHYPDSALPRVIGYVSRFNQGLFTVDHFVGVGLDQYLGSNCKYYAQMGIPEYLSYNKVQDRIPVDVMYAWATQIYPYNDSLDNLLSRMIYQGLLVHFVEAMYPKMEEHLKMGFNEDQMTWCYNNENQMWTHLVEEKLLFSSDPLVIRKLVENAPHTSYYTVESPGRAAVWQGSQIVKAFAKENPTYSLHQILSQRNYQEMLRRSRYHP